jgi:hypothetical protein
VGAIVAGVVSFGIGIARADLQCDEALTKGAAKAARVVTRALQRCRRLEYEGRIPGPCPDVPTAQTIASARQRLVTLASSVCATSTGEFRLGGRCPNVGTSEAGACTDILIQSKGDEGACLACLAEANASDVASLAYGNRMTPTPSEITTCQLSIATAVRDFYDASTAAAAECQAELLQHRRPDGCPDQKVLDVTDIARRKATSRIARACCGSDGTCGGTCVAGPAIGETCGSDADCQRCMSGLDNSKCASDAQCDGGVCSIDGRCSGDDLDPVADLGFPTACPALGPGTIGQTMGSLVTCIDAEVTRRVLCQGPRPRPVLFLPTSCSAPPDQCDPDGGTATITVSIDGPAAGIVIGLGYLGVTNDEPDTLVEQRTTVLQPVGLWVANNTGDQIVFAAVTLDPVAAGPLFSVPFETCAGRPTPSNFGCVVLDASDERGVRISSALGCAVTVE